MSLSDYIIYSDISADIPADYAAEKDIRFIPMSYTLGDEERLCSSIEPDEILKRFYDGQRKGDLTHTTQISPFKYVEVFEPLLKEGKSVLYISLSSGLSNTYNSSLIAADELNEKYPEAKLICVDSLGATGGMGALLEMAVKNRESGMSIEENAKYLEENRLRIYHWFMVEDLMYLKRGGRIPATTAIVGSALNIKPLLKVEKDGTLLMFAKKRGAKAAMNELLELYKTHSVGGDGERIIIIHADDSAKAEYLKAGILAVNPKADISTVMLSPIIGAHVGPGMCAIVHIAAEGVERP